MRLAHYLLLAAISLAPAQADPFGLGTADRLVRPATWIPPRGASWLEALELDPAGRTAYVSGRAGEVWEVDLPTVRARRLAHLGGGQLLGLAVSKRWVAVWREGKRIALLDRLGGGHRAVLPPPHVPSEGGPTVLDFSVDGSELLLGVDFSWSANVEDLLHGGRWSGGGWIHPGPAPRWHRLPPPVRVALTRPQRDVLWSDFDQDDTGERSIALHSDSIIEIRGPLPVSIPPSPYLQGLRMTGDGRYALVLDDDRLTIHALGPATTDAS
jgi:hypothetical protein